MAAADFTTCLTRLLAHEGGYTDHPADPGGPTNFGITIADYRRYVKAGATVADVKAMRVDEAVAIYRAKYWDALACDKLPAGVDDSVFDYGVNSGIGRAGKVLRRVLGLPDTDWHVDARVLEELAIRDPKAVITAINAERLRFLQSLKTWPVFGSGWAKRVAEVKTFSLVLAAGVTPAQPMQPAGQAKGEIAKPPAKTGAAVGGAVVAGGATAAHVHQGTIEPVVVISLLTAAALVAFGIWFFIHWQRTRRQEAPVAGIGVVPVAA